MDWVIFPRYDPERSLDLEVVSRARALAELVDHVVNFSELPRKHFSILDRLFVGCRAATLDYSDLDLAIERLTVLLTSVTGEHP